MTNASHKTLARFGEIAFWSYSQAKFYKTYSSWSVQPYGSQLNARRKRFDPQRRHINHSSDGSNQDCDNQSYSYSSSSSHQRHHRQTYERKRTFNDHNRNTNNNSNNNKGSNQASSSDPNGQMNHYQRLNIQQDADQETVKSAYYSLSKIYHPDVAGSHDSGAAENFRLITESYSTLSDPELKADYDRQLNQTSTLDIMMRSASHPNKDFNLMFRTRDADMIFRARQDAALQREKALNPKKFRAGVFKSPSAPVDRQAEISRLKQRLQYLSSNAGSHDDGSEFYKMHLFNTIQRRQSDLAEHESLYSLDQRSSDPSESTGISVLILFGAALTLFVVLSFEYFEINLADYMDTKLEEALKKKDEEEENEVGELSRKSTRV